MKIAVCHSEYIFLGSRLGNSLLLHFTEEDQSTIITIEDDDKDREPEKEVQKKRSEDEELEVYGTGTKTSVQLRKYTFEVCDSILNIGPIGYMCTGERMELDHDENTQKEVENVANMHLEIVTASGHNKNGALCVLQNSIKPQVLTSFELAGETEFIFLKFLIISEIFLRLL